MDRSGPSQGGKTVALADRNRRWREGGLTYAYILLYIALSSGQIFFNKWVLSSKQINFPYPVGLTLLHMLFSSVLCFVLTKVFKVIKIEGGVTPEIYATSVVPIGAMFAMTLWLGNSAYLYISVAFAQMLKATMPVAVFVLGAAAGLEAMSRRMFLIMSVISFGVVVASYGEVSISWVGVVYQMGGVVGEALRLVFMEIFVKKKGVRLNSISMMYYVSPCSVSLCSMDIFRETKDGFQRPLELPTTIVGVAAYNNHKLRKEAQRMSLEVRVDNNNVEKSPDQEVQIALLPPKEDK
ncbi:probable sugar phosphate/phosphate translocator At3g14410 isoform X2 [Elaeis guineensis]|uniref:probable sugar phosphate/phosphate translocator At3g14410 isoform X2 n=1 Tax=Elaeis guineensis var. tenera TaxID=51953 RepID=UPI003C6D13AF